MFCVVGYGPDRDVKHLWSAALANTEVGFGWGWVWVCGVVSCWSVTERLEVCGVVSSWVCGVVCYSSVAERFAGDRAGSGVVSCWSVIERLGACVGQFAGDVPGWGLVGNTHMMGWSCVGGGDDAPVNG